VKDWISIIIGEGGGDSPLILISSLWVVGSNEACGGIEGARGWDMARSRGVVVAVFSFHMGFTFVLYTLCLVFGIMSCRHKKSFQLTFGRI